MHRTNTLPLSLFSVCGLGRLRWIGNDLNSNTFLSTVALRNLRIKLIANDLNSFLALSNDMSTRVPLSRSDRPIIVFVKFFKCLLGLEKRSLDMMPMKRKMPSWFVQILLLSLPVVAANDKEEDDDGDDDDDGPRFVQVLLL